MEHVVKFAVRKYLLIPQVNVRTDQIEVDLATCCALAKVNHKYNSKFWWSIKLTSRWSNKILPAYTNEFLHMAKYTLFEVIADLKISRTRCSSAWLQLKETVVETVYGGLATHTPPAVHASLVKAFTTIVKTIEPNNRALFKRFVMDVFEHMYRWTTKFDMALLDGTLVVLP